jgi:esterase/lipase superfamily enzyme
MGTSALELILLSVFFAAFLLGVTPFLTVLRSAREKHPILNALYWKPFRLAMGSVGVVSFVVYAVIQLGGPLASRSPLPAAIPPMVTSPPKPSPERRPAAEPAESTKRDGAPAEKTEKAKKMVKAKKKNGAPPAKANGEPPKKATTISVFYGTDRNVTGDSTPALYYGATRGALQFGVCQVSIPEDHRVGKLESPFIAKIPLLGGLRHIFEDPEKHVVLLSVESKGREVFLLEVRRKIETSDKREAFVFIHGYNVTFEDSCRRTAQIAYDLKFTGAPISYSWPSDGRTANYVKDETDIEWSTPNFERFLLMVAEKTGARTVHLIAHSMGNRALVNALAAIARSRGEQAAPLFNQVVLTAPDIDAGVFLNLAQAVQKGAERATLYASSNDVALNASKKIHGAPRLGEAGPNITVIDGIDTIDVSAVDTSFIGHGYYADNRTVITDLFELLGLRKPPRERFHLRERKRDGLTYWEFRP